MPHGEKTKREGTEAAICAVLADGETGKEWPVPTTIVKRGFSCFSCSARLPYKCKWAQEKEGLFRNVKYFTQHRFVGRPSDSTLSEDAGIEPRNVATLALTARRSNHSLDLIHILHIVGWKGMKAIPTAAKKA
jgi:hypothetical protein